MHLLHTRECYVQPKPDLCFCSSAFFQKNSWNYSCPWSCGIFPIWNNLSVFLLHWDNSSVRGWWGFTSRCSNGHRQAGITAARSHKPERAHENFSSSAPLTWFNKMSVVLKYKPAMCCVRLWDIQQDSLRAVLFHYWKIKYSLIPAQKDQKSILQAGLATKDHLFTFKFAAVTGPHLFSIYQMLYSKIQNANRISYHLEWCIRPKNYGSGPVGSP